MLIIINRYSIPYLPLIGLLPIYNVAVRGASAGPPSHPGAVRGYHYAVLLILNYYQCGYYFPRRLFDPRLRYHCATALRNERHTFYSPPGERGVLLGLIVLLKNDVHFYFTLEAAGQLPIRHAPRATSYGDFAVTSRRSLSSSPPIAE